MIRTYPFEKEVTPLLILSTLLMLAWSSDVTFLDNAPVFWSLPGIFEASLSKAAAVWLIPLAGIALYMLSLVASLIPVPAAVHLRQARAYHVGKAVTLWALMGVYTVASLSALSVAMPVGFQIALGAGLLLFLVSAIHN